MRSATLDHLYRVTTDLFTTANSLGMNAGIGVSLDWVDRVLPDFTAACRDAVVNGSEEVFDLWGEWLEDAPPHVSADNGNEVTISRRQATSDGVGVLTDRKLSGSISRIREAGEADSFEWRRDWLRTLVRSSKLLYASRADLDESTRRRIAEEIGGASGRPFSMLPPEFWRDLVDTLAPVNGASTPKVASSFPLVLTERMMVAGDSIDVLLADFVIEKRPYPGAAAYPAPDQMATRCFDGEFLAVFKQAAQEVVRYIAPDQVSCARVRLVARRPEDDVFLQKLVIRGPSGGGALAAGLYALHRGHRAIDRALAVSFALSAPGAHSNPAEAQATDGLCHAVGGAYEKVRGCAKDGVRRLLVAREQASQVSFYGHLQDVAIMGVSTMADAVAVIESAIVPDTSATQSTAADDEGVIPLGSPLYVERGSDTVFREALGRRPMIVLVKGARQIGKTSMLVRGVDHVRRRDVRLVYVDLQSMGRESLRTQRDLFSSLARIFTRELKLDVTMDDIYDDRDGPNKNLENFLFKHALESPVIWFMDEVDRLFEFDYYTDVFSLMRSWHNRRPVHPELGNLTLVLSYATETHLLIEDAYQSPFNVGVKVELVDFAREQTAQLNERLGRPLTSEADLDRFQTLVGGHPHLVCRGLSWLAHEHKTLDEFADRSSLDNGPFGSHLRRLLMVAQTPNLLSAVQNMLDGGDCRCEDNDAFLHLRSAGLVIGDDCLTARIRCELYSRYLRRHLLARESKPVKSGFWQMIRRYRK